MSDNLKIKAKILVVDDEPLNLEIITEYLDDAGFELILAENGQVAWDILMNQPVEAPFDLVVLDRMMPVMDGMQLLAKIKAEVQFSHLPVIMQTAAATKNQIAEGLQQGAYYYLTKPYEREVLLSIIHAALEESKKHRELRDIVKKQSYVFSSLMHNAEFCFKTLSEARALSAFLASICPKPESAVIGLSEILINAVEHGNLGISYDDKSKLHEENGWEDEVLRRLSLPEYAYRQATVVITRHLSQIEFVVTDQGNGFDWQKYLEFSPDRAFDSHGRGIAMSNLISFNALEYQGKGNVVKAVITL